MADFLLIYQGGDPNWADKLSADQMQAAMKEWGAWFQELEASGNLRNPGAALVPGGQVVSKNGKGFHTDSALSEVKELIGGYSLIQADSIEEATKLAEGSPHLKEPGTTVLVRQVMESAS